MPIAIRNFGHYWNRSLVDWGTRGRGRGGTLLGFPEKKRKRGPTDFRNQIGIYVLFGENREVTYLGQTGSGNHRMFLRLRDHTRDDLRDRWSFFSWFGFIKVNQDSKLSPAQKPDAKVQGKNREALDEIEAVLLQLFEPRLNKQGSKWKTTEEYLQWVPIEHEDSDVEEGNDGRLTKALDRLERIENLLKVNEQDG